MKYLISSIYNIWFGLDFCLPKIKKISRNKSLEIEESMKKCSIYQIALMLWQPQSFMTF